MKKFMTGVVAAMVMGVMAEITNTVTVTMFHQSYPYSGKATVNYTVGGTLPANAVAEITINTDDASVTFVQSNIVAGANSYVIDFASSIGGALLLTNASFVVTIAEGLGGVQLWENGPYWAECNVGATKPEEYGYYFWWGDTAGYIRNGGTWDDNAWYTNVTWMSSTGEQMSSSPFLDSSCPTYGKSNSQLLSAGYIDATGNLAPEHDAAHVHWGGEWRMPTIDEIDALVSNCTTTRITTNGVSGRLVTGKGAYANRSIFLPAAGGGYGSDLRDPGLRGYYRSSTPDSGNSSYAWSLGFTITRDPWSGCNYRYFGRPVRPVRGLAQFQCYTVGIVTYDPIPGTEVPVATPAITGVTAQQRYPWNGKVDISYTVTGDIAAEAKQRATLSSLKMTVIDMVANTTNTATQLSGDLSLEEGTHTIVWDMEAEGFPSPFKSSNMVFNVACEITPAMYCVIDLSGGADATSYPVTYMAEPPNGGFNVDEYKTVKLVLRRIEAGSFKMRGSYDVTLTMPFFCGLFEVTQKQYSLVTGSNPSGFSGDKLPVEKVGYNAIRGTSNGAKWPSSSAVDSSSFMGKLRARTGLDFDLPTEAQWEYACRAGTTTTYSYGDSANGNYMWYSSNSSSKTHEVGTKSPNPWGLYDMHGNVREWCLDWYASSLSGGTDPKGSSSGSSRVLRGGGWNGSAAMCTSSYLNYVDPSDEYYSRGFRLVRTLSNE